jgi:hypothetical protein
MLRDAFARYYSALPAHFGHGQPGEPLGALVIRGRADKRERAVDQANASGCAISL